MTPARRRMMLQRPHNLPHRGANRQAELKAARDARHRQRVKAHKRVAPVEYGCEILDLLIATRWLRESDSADAQEIGRAISAMLAASSRS
jgi:hypothetical protein